MNRASAKSRRFRGAGILFFAGSGRDTQVLLAQRRRSGVWSIPGGGWESRDADLVATAYREAAEEFGPIPAPHEQRFTWSYPFGFLGFDWKTVVVEFAEPPAPCVFPDRRAKDFHEFRDASWFPLHTLPRKTHWLLHPIFLRLRHGGGFHSR